MNIFEASKIAQSEGKCITRESFTDDNGKYFAKFGRTGLAPTLDIIQSEDHAGVNNSKVKIAKYWNPQEEDLVAEDWIVI